MINNDVSPYYMPYTSEDDTDNTDDTDGTDDTEDIRIRREEDPRYAIIRAAGPNFNTSAQTNYSDHAYSSEYDVNTNITSLAGYGYLNPPKTTQTTLFCVKSGNRDKTVYPSPFNYQIKLPKVYKNVTKIQLVQLSFPFNTGNTTVNTTLISTFYNYCESLPSIIIS